MSENQNQQTGISQVFIPFGEMVTGDHFVLHERHLLPSAIDEVRKPSPVFAKTSPTHYKNVRSGQTVLVHDHNLFRTWCRVVYSNH